jgi:hypothetical protein
MGGVISIGMVGTIGFYSHGRRRPSYNIVGINPYLAIGGHHLLWYMRRLHTYLLKRVLPGRGQVKHGLGSGFGRRRKRESSIRL